MDKQEEALQYYNKGEDFFIDKKFDDALTCYEKAIELEPGNAQYWRSKGVALRRLGKYYDALVCHDKSVELDPNVANYWSHRGLVLRHMKSFDDALTCYEKAIELEPSDAYYWTLKGLTLYDLEKYQDALVCCNKAIELDPDNDSYKQRLVLMQANMQVQQMIETLEEKNKNLDEESKEREQREKEDQEYNYYDILGVSINAPMEEIKNRFRELSLKLHPDKETSILSQQTMKQIIEAYDTLKDSKKRKEYDDTL